MANPPPIKIVDNFYVIFKEGMVETLKVDHKTLQKIITWKASLLN